MPSSSSTMDPDVVQLFPYRDPDTGALEWDEDLLLPEEEREAFLEYTRRGKGNNNNNSSNNTAGPGITQAILAIDNLPIAPAAQKARLEAVVQKLCGVEGAKVLSFDMPAGADGASLGFAFAEYADSTIARTVASKLDGQPLLEKNKNIKVVPFSAFDAFNDVPDEYVAPEPEVKNAFEELQAWLVDPRGADQFVQSHGKTTEVVWDDASALGGTSAEDLEVVDSRNEWTQSWIPRPWSPKGTYMTTLHPQGIQVWGGPSFGLVQRFEHPGVQFIHWSPGERYLISASPKFKDRDNEKDPRCIIFWEMRSGKKRRGFTYQGDAWPVFQWSADDKYFGKCTKPGVIQVYSTETQEFLLDKPSITADNVRHVAWAPELSGFNRSKRLMAYFVPEVVPEQQQASQEAAAAAAKPKAKQPAKPKQPVAPAGPPQGASKPANVTILELPSRQVLQSKNITRVSGATLHWHPEGRFLAAKIHRQSKSKKVEFSQLEIFRADERSCPVDSLELKSVILDFAWEPMGNRFSILHTSDFAALKAGGNNIQPDLSFYDLSDGKLVLLKTLEGKQCNQMIWSPTGGNVVLAGLGPMGGVLDFYSVDLLESMGTADHYTSSQVSWDPTGRFVVSVVTAFKHKLETGYNLYSFSGKRLRAVLKDEFYQFAWRPRPPTLLTAEQFAEIKRDLPKLMQKYREQDFAARRSEQEQRRKKLSDQMADLQVLLARYARKLPPITFETQQEWIVELAETRERPM